MLIGIQVALAIAFHIVTPFGSPSAVTPAGGDIMYVSQPFAMSITTVPQTLSSTPRVQCPHFARPICQRSHP